MTDSPPPRASSYSPRSPLSGPASPVLPPQTQAQVQAQAWAWKNTSPALGPRRGLYAGRRGSNFSLDEDSTPSSPKGKASSPIAMSTHPDDQYTDSPISPRKGTSLPKCLSSENIEFPRFRKGSASEKNKKEDTDAQDSEYSTTTTTTTTTTTSTTPASPTAMSNQPAISNNQTTKLKPLIRIDSFGPERIVEEPAHVRKLREDVKQDVAQLMKARKLHALESTTSFMMRDTKNGKYTKSFIQLAKNHQVLQFGDSESVIGDDPSDLYFPLKIQVSNISLVEDRTQKDTGPASDTNPHGFHIWFFDKIHRGEYDLITNNEHIYVSWLEGLKALIGSNIETDPTTVKLLTEVEVDMRLYQMEINEANQHGVPVTPKPLAESSGKKNGKGNEDDEEWELWRKCYADLPDGEDCFDFAAYQHPLFIST